MISMLHVFFDTPAASHLSVFAILLVNLPLSCAICDHPTAHSMSPALKDCYGQMEPKVMG